VKLANAELLTDRGRATFRDFLWLNGAICVIFFLILFTMMEGLSTQEAYFAGISPFILYMACFPIEMILERRYRVIAPKISIDFISNVNMRVARALLAFSCHAYEALDRERVLASVSEDARLASDGVDAASRFAILFMFQIAEMFYLLYYSPEIFIISLVFLAIIYGFVFLILQRAMQMEKEIALLETEFYRGVEGLVSGFKELRLHRQKRESFLNLEIHEPLDLLADLKRREKILLSTLFIVADVSVLGFAAVFILGLPYIDQSFADIAAHGGLLILFFPLAFLMELPTVTRATLAATRLANLVLDLEKQAEQHDPTERRQPPLPSAPAPSLQSVVLQYRYPTQSGEAGFGLGPIDFEIPSGSITILAGGNGSGKSTCLKLLIGLYKPESGGFLLDGKPVDMQDWRHIFATVFVDSHLFRKIHGVDNPDPEEVQKLLQEWGIAHKTAYRNGRFTRISLSTGQKKRVAMVGALMENKPFLVLDEWAADQDPDFRIWFYRTFLPEMHKRGKSLIIASHDDRFFDIADQVLWFENGKLRQEGRP